MGFDYMPNRMALLGDMGRLASAAGPGHAPGDPPRPAEER
jgi:hypothetical protein